MIKIKAFILALGVYLLIGASIIFIKDSIKPLSLNQKNITNISLISFDKETDKANDRVNTKEAKKIKALKEVKKEIKKKIVKKSIKKPKDMKVKEPEPKPKPKPKKVEKEKKIIKPQKASNPTKESIRRRAKRGGGKDFIKLALKIKREIEKHKIYPPLARKRHIQGKVRVYFTLHRDGTVSNIKVEGAKIFKRYARKAIENAFPIDIKDLDVSLPHRYSLTLVYKLK